ncbi:MAG: BatA domain-containing protein, partial [Planctomycetia bacterium]|nr:BatA domain-containing protein [Planctomycetia bacterium]
MGWLSFTSLPFLLAGAIFATGPVIIHLLNRRRYRVVQWAAMDFLREALKKNRKILQLRDLVLLVLRTLAVLLFGAALARPYLASRHDQFDARQPLHAIIIIDNSLSMAYESLEGSLLDKAKDRARELIDRLPAGSQMTVIPACGAREPPGFDPLLTNDDAKEALGKIEMVDRSAKIASVANLARRACEEAPQLAKRIVFITDQQELNWRDARAEELFRGLPAMQVVSVAPSAPENAWIADLRVQDGLADMETPTTLVVKIAHRGSSSRREVPLTLSVGPNVIGQQVVSIEPGFGTREVSFECTLSGLAELPEPGQAVFVPLQATIGPDRLPADDQRCLAIPVVAALPVIFIDQYGEGEEDAARGRLGETRHLRRLLAPRTSHSGSPRQLISVRHVSPDSLSRELLTDARLVVVAGVRQPGPMADLLAEYIRQGGQLMIAAGADFDPAAWNAAGWQDGNGILPLPLLAEPIGSTPEEAADKLEPFTLAIDSLTEESIFQLAGVAEADLKALYAEPFFFKAVQVDDSPATLTRLKADAVEPAVDESGKNERGIDREPQVLARFETRNRAIFLVSRKIGRGSALFCSSGLLSSWNTLPKTNAILIFDRLLRGMIQNTLPQQNIGPMDWLTLPLPRLNQNLAMTLSRPGRVTEDPLEVSYIGAQERGVRLTGLLSRGIYQIHSRRISSATEAAAVKPVWELPLAVNGMSDESDLTA